MAVKVGVIKMVVRVLDNPPANYAPTSQGAAVAENHALWGLRSPAAEAAQAKQEAKVEAWWAELLSGPRQLKLMARVYVLEGRGLTAKDDDGKSDPYIQAKVCLSLSTSITQK
jgi:hypothetical protein